MNGRTDRLETVYPLKLRFVGGGGIKGRDLTKPKGSKRQFVDQTAVIHRQICTLFILLYA